MLVCGPTGCTSFGDEPSAPDAGPGPADGASGSDTGGGACRAACAGCFVDPFDSIAPPWVPSFDPGNAVSVVEGRLLASAQSGGKAYLGRQFSLSANTPLHLSFTVRAEVAPKDGTTLAKVVDRDGNEIGIQVDGGGVHSCVEAKRGGALSGDRCGELQALPLRETVRLTLDVSLPSNPFAPPQNIVKLAVACREPVVQTVLRADLLPFEEKVTLHFGLEGPGTVYYDDVDLEPSK